MSNTKNFKGVENHNGLLRVVFQYEKVRCREGVGLAADKASKWNKAARIREDVVVAIKSGRFSYADFFPASRSARKKGWIVDSGFESVKDGLLQTLETDAARIVESSRLSTERIITEELIPAFGSYDVRHLTTQVLQDWVNKKNRTLSPSSVRSYLKPLKAYLSTAVGQCVIQHSPYQFVKFVTIDTREPQPFTPDELASIYQQLDGVHLNLFRFLVATGLRPSEALALTWDDVTLTASDEYPLGSIYICKAKSRFIGVRKTKTKAGVRRVRLFQQAHDALQAQRQHTFFQQAEVFHNRYGEPFESSQSLNKHWLTTLKRAGVEFRSVYQLRHTYASILLTSCESPDWIAQQMGHRNSQVLYDHYARLISQYQPNLGDKAAQAFELIAAAEQASKKEGKV